MNILKNLHDYFFSKIIIYTKIIQWININHNNPLFSYFTIFSNKAPYINDDICFDELEKLKQKNKDIIINYEPINSGTISIIFKGILNKKEIIIKLKRKNIKNKIESSIYFLSYFLNFFPNKTLYKFVKNITEKFTEQTDFLKEIENIIFWNKKINHNYIKTLEVYENLSNNNLIVMNFIKAKTIYELNKSEKELFFNIYIKTFLYLIFIKKFVHLDAHPGNLLFLIEEKKIMYIDLGIVYYIENVNEIDYLFNFIKCLCNCNIDFLVKSIHEYKNDIYEHYTAEKINNLISLLLINNLFKNNDTFGEVSKNILKIINLTEYCGIIYNKNVYKLIMTLLTSISIMHHFSDGNAKKIFEIINKEFIENY